MGWINIGDIEKLDGVVIRRHGLIVPGSLVIVEGKFTDLLNNWMRTEKIR